MKMITVELVPGTITELPESELEGPVRSSYENERERVERVVYRFRGKVVHESSHVHLKQGIGIEGILGGIR